MNRAIFFAVMLSTSACTTKIQLPDLQPFPISHAKVRAGVQVVHSTSGGQVIIPDALQNVLTVDNYPRVQYAAHEYGSVKENFQVRPLTVRPLTEKLTNNKKIVASGAGKTKGGEFTGVWEKLCAGKVLSEEDRKILEENPLPSGYEKPCNPVWNGEK